MVTSIDVDHEEVDSLIAATWSVAAGAGGIEPSVREILHEAGLSTKAFYRHFRSKDDLLLVALDEGSRLLVEYIEHRMAQAPDPLARVDAWIEGFVRQVANPAAARRTLPWTLGAGRLAMTFPERFYRNTDRVTEPLRREIARAVADGTAGSPDPVRDCRIIYGYTMDTVRYHLLKDSIPDPATLDHLIGFTRRALGAKPRQAPPLPG